MSETLTGTEVLRLWSVTTLIKAALGAGPGLVNWHAEMTGTAAVDRRSTLDAMIKESGREAAIKWLTQERWNVSDKAKVRGTDVHAAAESIALGLEPIIVEGTEAYVEQLVRWQRKWKPEHLLAEAPVYNLEHAYAGTLDGIQRIDGRSFLIDYKTTPKGPDARSRPPYPEVALQLVAYANAQEVGVLSEQRYDSARQRYYLYDPTVEHAALPPVDGALCIVITPVDCFAVPVAIGPKVWDAWLHAVAVAQFQLEGSKHVFGGLHLDNRLEAAS